VPIDIWDGVFSLALYCAASMSPCRFAITPTQSIDAFFTLVSLPIRCDKLLRRRRRVVAAAAVSEDEDDIDTMVVVNN